MSTPASSATSYCSVSTFLQFYDWRNVADLVSDDGTRHTLASLTSDPNLAAILLASSGDVESAAFRGNRYIIDPASGQNDLASLTGASQALLQKLVADLSFGFLFERRPNPGVEPPIAYQLAIKKLDQIASGEAVFGILGNMQAGRPNHAVMSPQDAYGQSLTTSLARRYFGQRGLYRGQANQ